MICLKCGEVNSDTFRYCGMCGNLLDVPPQARRPAAASVGAVPRTANSGETVHPMVLESAPRAAAATAANPLNSTLSSFDSPSPGQQNQPSMDLLREKSFSGLDSFFEPEQPKGGRRMFLLLLLLVALGIAGWWTYTNYLGVTQSGKPTTSTAANADSPATEPPVNRSVKDSVPPDGASPQSVPSLPAEVPEAQPESAKAGSDAPAKTPETENPIASKPAAPATPSPKIPAPKVAEADKSAGKPESVVTASKPAKLTTPIDTGDAEFRKGEAALYGRGAPENCSEAVKNLKAASAKSNAKARSAFGTMYATGHCVPRDLPTSYLWFAMALQVDPNNQILEKDLSAVWNQMTPPERQLAMRMKQ